VARRVLIVTAVPLSDPGLEELVGDAEVRVVAPASKLSPLEWLTNDEDAAREAAGEVADRTSGMLGGKGSDGDVEAEVGDPDPLLAAEDALRTFAADEIVVVVPPKDKASWLERGSVEDGFGRYGLPVRYVVADEA
jgi:hypothetical protein